MRNENNSNRKVLHKDLIQYVSDGCNLARKTVHSIITTYIDIQCSILLKGNSIYFGSFATIQVSEPETNLRYSTSTIGYIIADVLGIPYSTTVSVLKKYLETLKNCVIMGYSTGVQSIFRVKPRTFSDDGSKVTKVNSNMATYLLEELNKRHISASVSIRNLRNLLKISENNTNNNIFNSDFNVQTIADSSEDEEDDLVTIPTFDYLVKLEKTLI